MLFVEGSLSVFVGSLSNENVVNENVISKYIFAFL